MIATITKIAATVAAPLMGLRALWADLPTDGQRGSGVWACVWIACIFVVVVAIWMT